MKQDPLITILFGVTPNEDDVNRWKSQKFRFSSQFPFSIDQLHGGPCGILAPVQAFLLKKLIFECGGMVSDIETLLRLNSETIEDALETVLLLLLKRAVPDNGGSIRLVQLGETNSFVGSQSLDLKSISALDFTASLIATRGIDLIRADMDDSEVPLIGRFGHCSQELLNLVLFGQAISNVFDGVQSLGDNIMILRGVPAEATVDVGLLSELEVLRYVTVGTKLKNPTFPFWIIGSPSHYTLLFSFNASCNARSASESREDLVRTKFNEFSFDEGIALADNLGKITSGLGLPDTVLLAASAKTLAAEGVVIFDDFLKWVLPLLPGSHEDAKKSDDAKMEFWFINGQTPVQLLNVCSGSKSNQGGSGIEGSLMSIMRTRWPNLRSLEVNPLK